MSTAATRRQILSELSSGSRSRGSRRGWRITWYVLGGLAGLLLVVAAGVGYWWWSSVNDPRVVAIVQQSEQLRERFFPSSSQVAANGGMSQADADEMVAAMTSLRGQMEQLPEHLRPVAGMQIGRMFFSGMQQQLDDYFATPPAQRQAVLDQHIYQMEAMRTAFARTGQGFGGPPGGSNGGQTNGQASGGQNSQGGPPWARNRNEGDRNEWRKRIIDRTTPEQRARWTEYRNAVDKRRDELGLGNPWRG